MPCSIWRADGGADHLSGLSGRVESRPTVSATQGRPVAAVRPGSRGATLALISGAGIACRGNRPDEGHWRLAGERITCGTAMTLDG